MFGRVIGLIEEEEHKILRSTVRKFVEEKLIPITQEIDEKDMFPFELFKECAKLGFTGVLVDEEYGGLGDDVLSMVIILEEISRVSPALGLSLLAHTVLCAHNINRFGSRYLKEKYLPGLVKGEIIGGLAITEPDAGSDVESIKTLAKLEDSFFVIKGTKTWITNAPISDVLIVYTLTSTGKPRDSMSAILVETNTPGVQITKSFPKMGMRGSPTGQVFFDNVKVPIQNLVGELNRGFYQLMKSFEIERLVISALGLGIALEALNWIVKHSSERVQFGTKIKEFELIQEKIAEISGLLDVLRTYVYLNARNYRFDEDLRFEAACSKYLAGLISIKAALEGIQVLGGYGYSKEYPLERFLRDAKLIEIGAGTTEIMKIIMARDILTKVEKGLLSL